MKNRFHKYLQAFIVALLFVAASQHRASAQQVGLKTNALMWAALTPNLGCEFVIHDHSSLDISAFGHYKPFGLQSQFLAVQPEYRYWFNGRPMVREYVGVSAMAATYDITTKKHVYDGIAASVGVTGGYAFLIGKHWRFELCAGLSLLFFNQKQYFINDDYYVDDMVPANAWGYKLFPAKLGASFTYIIR